MIKRKAHSVNATNNVQSKLKNAIDHGKISQADIHGIVQRFQEYEQRNQINKQYGIPLDSLAQIKARNIITDRTSLEFNKRSKKE